ncbi:UPF0481 protein At3g47200 [Quercus suber]|uniref:UPF0481 protein At3g47200 n=1 Tax=Quercus suber TaxID=58331 RepID=UPI000CE17B66|nr:UPF0481 protein At3g47200-like [Quercus suber]
MEESAGREIQLATAPVNNEDQNTQKEANLSGENENKNDELVIEIREMFERPEIQSLTPGRIYKVPHHLRKWNEEAYTPQVISIGPFYHKNERLKAMEEHKERYFRSFVNRSNINLEYLVGTIREMEKSIRGCYEETIDLTSDRFVKMILVDACFILELLFKCSSGSQTSDDPVVEEPRATIVMIDWLLLENQLPFIVIDKLHHLVFPSLPDNALLELSILYFGKKFISEHTTLPKNLKIEHFTDLVRTFLLPPPEKRPKGNKKLPEHYLFSATQLHKAGVKFKHGQCECNFDIKFEKGVLEIPTLVLNDLTEVVFRNIMALEQTCYIENAFMDLLINTGKDVDLLCVAAGAIVANAGVVAAVVAASARAVVGIFG